MTRPKGQRVPVEIIHVRVDPDQQARLTSCSAALRLEKTQLVREAVYDLARKPAALRQAIEEVRMLPRSERLSVQIEKASIDELEANGIEVQWAIRGAVHLLLRHIDAKDRVAWPLDIEV